MYPTEIEANGKIYKINTDYRVGLSCFKAIDDDEISDTERAVAIITLLLGKKVKLEDYEACLEKCAIYLRCGKKENDDVREADMDYLQDESLIRSSIRQCYHLNLNQIEYMHWWEYNELIEGLTDDTILSRVRDLRNYDLKDEKDLKRKREIQKTQKQVALKKKETKVELTEKQQNSVDEFYKALGF